MRATLKTQFLAISTLLIAATVGACSTVEQLPSNPIPAAADAPQAQKSWQLALNAHISHISVTPNGALILVSTSSERKTEAGLRLLNNAGRVLWYRGLPQPVKAQAISDDGKLLVVNTYDGKLRAFNAKGQQLWEHEHYGRPVILSTLKRVLLFNDDDSEPRTAFVSYDYTGKEAGRVVSQDEALLGEPLDIYAADDESAVIVTMPNNTFTVYEPDGKKRLTGALPGGSVAVAAIGTPELRVYVLTGASGAKKPQQITAYAPGTATEMRKLWSTSVGRARYETVRLLDGRVVLYGNTHRGQALAAFKPESGARAWERTYSSPASYSSLVFATPRFVTAAIDEGTPAGELRLVGLDFEGKAAWEARLEAADGIYSYALAKQGPAVAVGAGAPGSGIVQYFRIPAQ